MCNIKRYLTLILLGYSYWKQYPVFLQCLYVSLQVLYNNDECHVGEILPRNIYISLKSCSTLYNPMDCLLFHYFPEFAQSPVSHKQWQNQLFVFPLWVFKEEKCNQCLFYFEIWIWKDIELLDIQIVIT